MATKGTEGVGVETRVELEVEDDVELELLDDEEDDDVFGNALAGVDGTFCDEDCWEVDEAVLGFPSVGGN